MCHIFKPLALTVVQNMCQLKFQFIRVDGKRSAQTEIRNRNFRKSLVNGKQPMSSTKTQNTAADANGNRNFISVFYNKQERLRAMCLNFK